MASQLYRRLRYTCASLLNIGAATARNRCAHSLPSWHAEVCKVAASSVLPLGLGGERDVRVAAWRGDKILAMAIATELEEVTCLQNDRSDTVGSLTARFAAAVSNRNMAENLDILLPPHLLEVVPQKEQRARQDHDCGTLIEACVAEVQSAGGEYAIAELARFLVAAAGVGTGSGDANCLRESNPKGALLEMGGNVSSELVGGICSHAPAYNSFLARASACASL